MIVLSEEKYLTLDDVSELLQMPKSTLYKYTAKNTVRTRLKGVRIGRTLRFRKSDLHEWIKNFEDGE